MVGRCTCGLDYLLSLFYKLNAIIFQALLHHVHSMCIDSGYLVCTTATTVFVDTFETLQMFWSRSEDMSVA